MINAPVAITLSATPTYVSCNGLNDGTATITAIGGMPGYSFFWSNNQTTSTATSLPFGTYSVTTTDSKGCTAIATVTITEPTVLTNTVSQTNVSCFGGNNGTAAVIADGGSPAYTYLWGSGHTTSAETGLNAGNYSVKTTDANGCTTTATVAITQPAALIAGFNASTYTVDIAVNNSVTFTNNSSGATSYQWNFGDTSGTDISANPAHSYTYTGTYTVTLIALDGACSDTLYKTIEVVNSNPLVVNGNQSLPSSVNVLYDNGEVFLLFSLDKKTQVNISVYNMMGEKISSQNNLLVKNEKIKLDLPAVSAGIYIAVSDMGDAAISKKIFIPAAR
jgi:PKD repeat protein